MTRNQTYRRLTVDIRYLHPEKSRVYMTSFDAQNPKIWELANQMTSFFSQVSLSAISVNFDTVKAKPSRQPSHSITALFPVLFRPPPPVSWLQTLIPLLLHLASLLPLTTTGRWFCQHAAGVCWGAPTCLHRSLPPSHGHRSSPSCLISGLSSATTTCPCLQASDTLQDLIGLMVRLHGGCRASSLYVYFLSCRPQ
jgi:hypothetical protein